MSLFVLGVTTIINSSCEISIGARLNKLLIEKGMKIVSSRSMTKLCRPGTFEWQWPYMFLTSYILKLETFGYLTNDEVIEVLLEIEYFSKSKYISCQCPPVIEVIAEKM